MGEKQVVRRIQQKDLELLAALYQYRAFSTQQLMRFFQMTNNYANKKMHVLRNSDWIRSYPLLSEHHRKRGAYHALTETGLSVLRNHGFTISKKAEELRVSRRFLPYLLAANDLMIDLAPYGWRMKDSREIKKQYGLNRGSHIHGALIDPDGEEYGFYIFMSRASSKNMAKVIREIKESPLYRFMIFTKGQSSFHDFIAKAVLPGQEVITGGALKVMPYTFGKKYLQFSSGKFSWEPLLASRGIRLVETKAGFDPVFNTLVFHAGEEKYLVSLLETDLMKVHQLKRYRKDQFARDGRKVLILTHMKDYHQDLLKSVHHAEYIEIQPSELFSAQRAEI